MDFQLVDREATEEDTHGGFHLLSPISGDQQIVMQTELGPSLETSPRRQSGDSEFHRKLKPVGAMIGAARIDGLERLIDY